MERDWTRSLSSGLDVEMMKWSELKVHRAMASANNYSFQSLTVDYILSKLNVHPFNE